MLSQKLLLGNVFDVKLNYLYSLKKAATATHIENFKKHFNAVYRQALLNKVWNVLKLFKLLY